MDQCQSKMTYFVEVQGFVFDEKVCERGEPGNNLQKCRNKRNHLN